MNKGIFGILILLLLACSNRHDPLLDAVEKLQGGFSEKELELFKEEKEEDLLNKYHFTGHMEDSILREYFYSNDIRETEHMGNIIYLSLHRKLNNRPIGIEEQIQYYQNR